LAICILSSEERNPESDVELCHGGDHIVMRRLEKNVIACLHMVAPSDQFNLMPWDGPRLAGAFSPHDRLIPDT
jgi:hypothetical protein